MAFETENEFEDFTEFADMKVIWDSQNEERLYAINENALYTQIKKKGTSVHRLLRRFEFVMIGVNLLVGIALIGVERLNDGAPYEYILPVLYLGYAVVAFGWRQTRRQEDVSFEQTMLGELDKAIWQVNYLIRRSRELILIYLAPLTLVMTAMMLYKGQPLFALAVVVVMVGAAIFTDRWEIQKCYYPQKQSLESLRATLISAKI